MLHMPPTQNKNSIGQLYKRSIMAEEHELFSIILSSSSWLHNEEQLRNKCSVLKSTYTQSCSSAQPQICGATSLCSAGYYQTPRFLWRHPSSFTAVGPNGQRVPSSVNYGLFCCFQTWFSSATELVPQNLQFISVHTWVVTLLRM